MLEWLYHGRNRKQCFSDPNCLVCIAWTFIRVIQIAGESKRRKSPFQFNKGAFLATTLIISIIAMILNMTTFGDRADVATAAVSMFIFSFVALMIWARSIKPY